MSLNTLGGALDHWLIAQGLNKKQRTKDFHREVAGIIRREWPDLSVPAASVTTGDMLAFAQRVAHYCPSRWNLIVSIMRAITPAGKVMSHRKLKFRQFRPPNQTQFTSLLAECDSQPRSHAGIIIRFLSFTGLRISEAMALTWLDVFDDRIEVRAEIAKNGKMRTVPIIPGAREVIDRLRAFDSGGYVLPRTNARKAITNACKRVGIDPMSHHSFRHLFATRCIESGVDLPTVARWLGHVDGGAMLSKVYFHLLDEHSRNMAARVKIAA